MPNRLAREKSAYLRQHASNPVDWYPWGEEAFERARRGRKPILLSIGYSACHWCHVMAHESFEDPEIARSMNEHFVNVKVDREERPDLDQLYQGAVQLLGRSGGWPLTVFLTPDLRPFYGGTYFPKDDRYGLPGFGRLLAALHRAYEEQPEDVEAQAREFLAGMERLANHGVDSEPAELSRGDLVAAGHDLAERIDPVHGGFGSAPKFPAPANVELLLRAHRRGAGEALADVRLTLESMARGGLYDQLGGGFHRYSVDERWAVPHFEKMLYDNAQLLHLYSEAQRASPDPLWRKVVEETAAYVERELTSPEGGFFASQDADSEGEEGRFFVWRPEELDRLLPAGDAQLAKLYFDVSERGDFAGGATVLSARRATAALAKRLARDEGEISAGVARVRAALFAAREQRVKPARDEKILAGWNGLMLRGLALASRVLHRPQWASLARRAADLVLAQLWDGERLLRVYQDGPGSLEGLVEDYGALSAGLVALFEATFEPRYLEAALRIADRGYELFWDEERSTYLTAPRARKDLVARAHALEDGAIPSGASLLAEAQVALSALTGDPRHLERAGVYLRKMASPMTRDPSAFGHLWLAADAYLEGAAEVTIVGPQGERDALIAVVNRVQAPTVAVLAHDPALPPPPVMAEVLRERTLQRGRAAAYLCRRFSCEAPVTEPAELEAKLLALA